MVAEGTQKQQSQAHFPARDPLHNMLIILPSVRSEPLFQEKE